MTSPDYSEAKADMRKRLLDWIEKAEGARPVIMGDEDGQVRHYGYFKQKMAAGISMAAVLD